MHIVTTVKHLVSSLNFKHRIMQHRLDRKIFLNIPALWLVTPLESDLFFYNSVPFRLTDLMSSSF